jgi:predicted HAD superfamily phosphohydrolase
MQSIQVNTACEGPLALNDNAFELCRDFLPPDGIRFFTQVSRYVDYLTNLAPRPDFKAGDLLKLILPFLKGAGLTNQKMATYSQDHLTLMPGAEAAYRFLHTLKLPLFAVSAGGRPFAEAVAARLGFAPFHLYCTEVNLEGWELPEAEAAELRRLLGEITATPAIELPPEAKTLADLAPEVQEAIGLFNTIFWEKIPGMDVGRLYQEANAMGGPEKAQSLEDSLSRTGLAMTDLMYVGSSSTDGPALEKVRNGGGVALAFNAHRDAVKAAEIIVAADTAWPVALMAAVFQTWGKEGVVELAQSTRPGASKYLAIPETMIEPIMMGLQSGKTFNLYHPSTADQEKIMADSTAMRRRLLGEAIANLG